MSESVVEWLTIAGDPEAWRSIGLVVTDDGEIPLHGTDLRIVPPAADGPAGLVGWTWSGIEPVPSIDGLATEVVDPGPPVFADHPVGAVELDHVVVYTHHLAATSAAIAGATGHEQRRVRELGKIRQGFHRAGRGGLIVEVVEHPDAEQGPARFWGLVITVDDLDAAYELLGPDRMTAPRDAVQPGRHIATIAADVGLGTAVALMSRDLR